MITAVVTDRPEVRSIPRSTGAIVLGLVTVIVLSLGTDQLLHMLNVYPPWGEPMYDPWLNLLALTYRVGFAILGSYIAAAYAPHSPMRHAMTVGFIGLVLSAAGAVAATRMADLGPLWYPVALVITAIPSAWAGGALYRARKRRDPVRL
jgi:hypothetical protein